MPLDDDELLDLARVTVAELEEACLYNGETFLILGGPAEVRELARLLQEQIGAERGSNPAFSCMPETASALIVLAATDQQAYGQLVACIDWAQDDVRTLAGLRGLRNLISLVSDDHDFSLKDDGSSPSLIRQPLEPFRPTVTPRSLLEAVSPLLDQAPSLTLS